MAYYLIQFGQTREDHNFSSLVEAKHFAEHRRQPEHQIVVVKAEEYPHHTYQSTWHVSAITGQGHWTDWKKIS